MRSSALELPNCVCVCDVRELPVTQRHTLLNLGRAQTAVTKESRKAPPTRHAKNTLSAFGELPGARWIHRCHSQRSPVAAHRQRSFS